jgi:dihydroneopterin aldolase
MSPFPAVSHADAPAPMDLIFIEGLRGETVIGIHESELNQAQPVVIDVVAGVPRARACDTDRIVDTIDYSAVRTRLQRLLVEHRLQLLEAFAEAIAGILLEEFGASWVRVKVVKPGKFDDVQAVGVQIERHAPPHGTSRAAPGATVLKFLATGMVPAQH